MGGDIRNTHTPKITTKQLKMKASVASSTTNVLLDKKLTGVMQNLHTTDTRMTSYTGRCLDRTPTVEGCPMTEAQRLRAFAEETEYELLFADGFDEAILGVVQQFHRYIVLYDREKCIEILMKDGTREEAEEYFEFNVVGGWHGEQTPCFLTKV